MLDVHPPHESAHTWTDFFIHIATITVGLVIAIGLEQSVEAIHHNHQRHQLEEKLHDELHANLAKDEDDFRKFAEIRAYLVELKTAVSARNADKRPLPSPPAATDTRRQRIPTAPSMAVWETAKLDATVTLLPAREIDLYSAVLLQHTLLFRAIDDFQHSAFELESFEERFVDSPGAFDMGYAAVPPDIDSMTAAERSEYAALLATYIKAIDRVVVRIHFFDRTARAVLDGAKDKADLMRRAFPGEVPPSVAPPKL